MGLLELADTPRDGAGERAFLVAEEFGFEQILGNRGAVDRDEILFSAPAFLVHVAGDQFLAGAGFAGDQDARFARRHLLGELENVCHCGTAVHDRAAFLGHCLQHRGDELRIRRQRNEFLGARLDCPHRLLGVVADAAADDRHDDAFAGQTLDQVFDVELGVRHDHVGAAPCAQCVEGAVDVIDMGDGGAAFDGDLACGADLPVERTDYQKSHPSFLSACR